MQESIGSSENGHEECVYKTTEAQYRLVYAVFLFSSCLHVQHCIQAFSPQCLLLVLQQRLVGATNSKPPMYGKHCSHVSRPCRGVRLMICWRVFQYMLYTTGTLAIYIYIYIYMYGQPMNSSKIMSHNSLAALREGKSTDKLHLLQPLKWACHCL